MADKEPTSVWDALADGYSMLKQPNFNAQVKYGNTNFQYADLSECMRVVKEAYQSKGLFIHFDTVEDESGKVVAVETVVNWREQEARMGRVPVNAYGKPQDVGSALTYAKRYSLCMAFGLAADADDDGQQGAGQTASEPVDVEALAKKHAWSQMLEAERVYGGIEPRPQITSIKDVYEYILAIEEGAANGN